MKDKLLHVKKLVEMTTSVLSDLVKCPAELVPVIDHPQEFLERINGPALMECQAQETVMRLLELNMQMRTELIHIGISYAKEETNT